MKNIQVCIDASLILRTLVPGPFSQEAETLLAIWQQTDITLIAPALFAFEMTSTLRRLVYLQEIQPERGEAAFAAFRRLNIQLSHRKAIFPTAWELAKRFNLSRAYDTAYLALAQLNRCEFWTADEKLYNAVHHELSWVGWIGEYARNL